ncbi:MAG: secreted glycosyl hydrolase [Euryarchaeota archaeon]|jgi:hypothetical protein|nr:secreted glycosyl hydrolase [Euryarchaeota archaeon]|tara:strand:+ start:85 stop:675 length:591 start_codon:yes stop_codon:yes gene_type:complete
MFLKIILSVIFNTLIQTDTISLFNGKNLDGWKIHGTEKWYVKDGEIICESGPEEQYGYLSTINSYKNFILKLDFYQESDGNSGVFFRSSIDGVKISGWQVEVAPPGNNSGGIYESYGRGWLIKPDPKYDDIVKMNMWNSMKVMVNGDNVKTWINGQEMIEITDSVIGKANGSIALQIHDGGGIKVRWKNFKLTPIN